MPLFKNEGKMGKSATMIEMQILNMGGCINLPEHTHIVAGIQAGEGAEGTTKLLDRVAAEVDDLVEFERQAVPLVEAYHRLKNDMVAAEQRSYEWRERLLSVAGQYAA